VAEPHNYLSTACFHGLHERCRQHCKFCDVQCKCGCHKQAARVTRGEPAGRRTPVGVIEEKETSK
jgi:hypothetical protein